MPDDAMEVYVVGKQWMWKMQHETGQREINELHVPVGRKVKLTMTTEDVLHDFFVPGFSHQGRRRSGPLYVSLVRSHKTWEISFVLCRILRAQPLRDGRLCLCDGAAGLRQLAERKRFGPDAGRSRERTFSRISSAVRRATPGGPQQRGAKLEGIFSKEVKLVGGEHSQGR